MKVTKIKKKMKKNRFYVTGWAIIAAELKSDLPNSKKRRQMMENIIRKREREM